MFEVRFIYKDEKHNYVVLGADLGYTFKWLSFKRADIAEILGISIREMMEKTRDLKQDTVLYKLK